MGGPEVTALHSNRVIQTGTIYKKPQETVNYFMREVPIIYKPVFLLYTSMDWFLYDRDLCYERGKGRTRTGL